MNGKILMNGKNFFIDKKNIVSEKIFHNSSIPLVFIE